MAPAVVPATLHVARLPGELGPTVHCSGDLSEATAPALEQELESLVPSSHRLVTLDISQCSSLDLTETLALFEAFRRRRGAGQRLVVLAGDGLVGRVLSTRRGDGMVLVFATEQTARRALVDQSIRPPVIPTREMKD